MPGLSTRDRNQDKPSQSFAKVSQDFSLGQLKLSSILRSRQRFGLSEAVFFFVTKSWQQDKSGRLLAWDINRVVKDIFLWIFLDSQDFLDLAALEPLGSMKISLNFLWISWNFLTKSWDFFLFLVDFLNLQLLFPIGKQSSTAVHCQMPKIYFIKSKFSPFWSRLNIEIVVDSFYSLSKNIFLFES